MNGNEIRDKINYNNQKIKELLEKFILTDEIKNLTQENHKLRTICEHNFVDGICEYCYALEKEYGKNN